ncbi:MAG: hypothetical protein WAV32_05535 [Halobacteriota archaeon]
MHWREKELLELLKGRKLNTSEVVKRADMSKTTTLKYLEGLKGKGLITCEMIGPTKLWSRANDAEEVEAVNVNKTEKTHEQSRIEEFVHVDREIFKLLDEFERATGERLEVVINKEGIKLRIRLL